MGRGGLSPRTQVYCRVTNNKREITKDKRINGKSLRETETNGKSPTTPPREIPIWKQKFLSLKSLRKNLFHYYYSSHLAWEFPTIGGIEKQMGYKQYKWYPYL